MNNRDDILRFLDGVHAKLEAGDKKKAKARPRRFTFNKRQVKKEQVQEKLEKRMNKVGPSGAGPSEVQHHRGMRNLGSVQRRVLDDDFKVLPRITEVLYTGTIDGRRGRLESPPSSNGLTRSISQPDFMHELETNGDTKLQQEPASIFSITNTFQGFYSSEGPNEESSIGPRTNTQSKTSYQTPSPATTITRTPPWGLGEYLPRFEEQKIDLETLENPGEVTDSMFQMTMTDGQSTGEVPKFVAPVIQDNPTGWGPCELPDQFKDISDWTGAAFQDKKYANKYASQFGSGSQYAYYHDEDESTFHLVDTTRVQKPPYQRGRLRGRGGRAGVQGSGMQSLGKGVKARDTYKRSQVKKWGQGRPQIKIRDASVTVKPDWVTIEEMDFPRLGKLSLPNVKDGEDITCCGELEYYDKSYDHVNVKNEKPLQSVNRIFHTAINSDNTEFDLLTVNETSVEPPQDSPRNLALEATFINHNFSQQVLRTGPGEPRFKFDNPNPFISEEEEGEVASVAYRYRKYDLGSGIFLVVRCEHDAVVQSPNGELQFLSIKALNEWDSKLANGVKWRQKLDTQRGAVLANELRNNACKLAKWTVQALLAGSDQIKFGYYKPHEFATQINLNMDNAWGILRCIIDIVMKQKDGKYLIMKDPSKPMIRLYDIPDNTFESDGESEWEDEVPPDSVTFQTLDFVFLSYISERPK
ncbi:Eukaryotic translation initiation factor 3 subunit D-1-like Protein [Tribolium castaneum]|uniref:Eukaryotic translation initiation factor 3 subunit p66 n=1 Tax=Tribolium castaneum TaxID=7070 RepID=A0A139WD71_TRICA|nr:Eukaryotic translation initiation factor 3 subunit D-1-like Protein [Tribolium castaneum]